MQHTVEHQDFQFVGNAVAVETRIVAGDLGGDGNVTAGRTREGEHIGRLVFAAKTAVELAKALVAGDQDIHLTLDLCQSLRLADEALDLHWGYTRRGGRRNRFFKNDHSLLVFLNWLRLKQSGRASRPPANILLNCYCCRGGSLGSCSG